MLSVKQGGIKYHFFSLCYDSTWDWTQVSGLLANTLTMFGFYRTLKSYKMFLKNLINDSVNFLYYIITAPVSNLPIIPYAFETVVFIHFQEKMERFLQFKELSQDSLLYYFFNFKV